jgi:hypothetical protein
MLSSGREAVRDGERPSGAYRSSWWSRRPPTEADGPATPGRCWVGRGPADRVWVGAERGYGSTYRVVGHAADADGSGAGRMGSRCHCSGWGDDRRLDNGEHKYHPYRRRKPRHYSAARRDIGRKLSDRRMRQECGCHPWSIHGLFMAVSGDFRSILTHVRSSPRDEKALQIAGLSGMEPTGIEPVTYGLQSRRSPS